MDVFVDGELESLLGMFNFDQCSSSSKEERSQDEMLGFSSLYNDHMHHHQHQQQHQKSVLSSDHHALLLPDMFPFGVIPRENLPAMVDSWDRNHQLRETSSLKRTLVNMENLSEPNSNYDGTRQELVRSKKRQKLSSECNESNTNWTEGQSLSNSTSDEEKASVSSVKGKTRASKGTATDPQSLYARKRREKINERLKTLQNLVPNGTKVDISTMLEEAVNYVKFLQLQIKLLSSDDLWMYAPLAYNGVDMGFHHNLMSRLM